MVSNCHMQPWLLHACTLLCMPVQNTVTLCVYVIVAHAFLCSILCMSLPACNTFSPIFPMYKSAPPAMTSYAIITYYIAGTPASGPKPIFTRSSCGLVPVTSQNQTKLPHFIQYGTAVTGPLYNECSYMFTIHIFLFCHKSSPVPVSFKCAFSSTPFWHWPCPRP